MIYYGYGHWLCLSHKTWISNAKSLQIPGSIVITAKINFFKVRPKLRYATKLILYLISILFTHHLTDPKCGSMGISKMNSFPCSWIKIIIILEKGIFSWIIFAAVSSRGRSIRLHIGFGPILGNDVSSFASNILDLRFIQTLSGFREFLSSHD